jgi:hypothetical protein
MTPDDTEIEADLSALVDTLDIGVPGLRTVGRPAKTFHVEYVRDLTTTDMMALNLPRGVAPVQTIARIRASHHSLARCIATGMKHSQAGLVTGYNPSTISNLLNDTAFQALVEDYRMEAKSVMADLSERMSDLSLDAIELLQEKLHDRPQEFTVSTLLDLITKFADRTGHGPNQEVNLKVSGDFIDRPPRESFEDWERRRSKELAPDPSETPPLKSIN